MRNPLNKRLPRELKDEIGKYLVIFLLMVSTIGLVCGYMVSCSSMLKAYDDSFEKYNIENGHFLSKEEISQEQWDKLESLGISLYKNYYVEKEMANDTYLRIFQNREEVNKACLMEGKFPKKTNEIAIDRMYADNNNLKVGDSLKDHDGTWRITGLVALSDYSALFQDNNDSMFDSIKFGVALVTADSFKNFKASDLNYSYAWKYDEEPSDELEEKEVSQELIKDMSKEISLEEVVPRYLNQAINFTGEDLGGDRAMVIILLYMIILIMAFVFAVTISNTISKEANVIGTLRASGYTRGELLRHYMAMPIIVTFIGAIIGNIMGYSFMKDVIAKIYYGSYSLPTYVTIWNGDAFLLTTVVPILIMLVVTFFVLHAKLKLSPLKFIRRDLSKKKEKRAFKLSQKIPFFQRFRLRIILQNRKNYLVLILGLAFANMLLMFGLALPEVLNHYQKEIETGLFANYQYMLQVPLSAKTAANEMEKVQALLQYSQEVETKNKDAEKFSAYSLETLGDAAKEEKVTIYGVSDDSKYISLDLEDLKEKEVYISSAYADKYLLKKGNSITLKEKYDDKKYTFKVAGIYDYAAGVTVFMGQSQLNDFFDLGDDYFCGYFSDSKITDIKDEYIATVINLDSLSKVSRQLNNSMGNMMYMVDGFAVGIFMVIIYLLSKLIIEKNAQSISMAKILGYSNAEISKLYILATSLVVVFGIFVTMPLIKYFLTYVFRIMMLESYSGWLPLYVPMRVYIKMFLLGLATYGLVAIIEYRRIRKVPMDEALKNVE